MLFNQGEFFPPSDRKLQELRQLGIIPLSKDVLTFAVLLSFMIWGLVLWSGSNILSPSKISQTIQNGFILKPQLHTELERTQTITNIFKSFYLTLIQEITSVLIIFFGLTTLIGLLQTKFLFAFKTINFNLERLFKPRAGVFNIKIVFGKLLKTFFWVIVAVFSLKLAFENYFFHLKETNGMPISNLLLLAEFDHCKQIFSRLCIAALVFSLFIGVITRLLAEISFKRRYSMSRIELEAEQSVASGQNTINQE